MCVRGRHKIGWKETEHRSNVKSIDETAATSAPSPMIEYVAPAPVVTYAAPAPVIEHVSSALVIEYIAPALAVSLAVPRQQLLPAHTTTTDTTDDNFDITDLVNPKFSISAVEAYPLQVVGSLSPLEEFVVPVFNQIHREQIVAGETTQNTVENPAVQEQVIVQEIPPIVERIQERIVEPIEVLPHERVQQFTAEQIMHMPVPQTQEQSAITDLVNPPISLAADEVVESLSVSEEVAALADMTTLNTSSTSTSSSAPVCNCEETIQNTIDIPSSSSTSTSGNRLDELAGVLDSCLEQLTPLAVMGERIEKELERIEMLTKLMMETPSPAPPFG